MAHQKEFSFIIVWITIRTKLGKISTRTLPVKIGYAVTSFCCLQSSLMPPGPRADVERGTVAIIPFKVSVLHSGHLSLRIAVPVHCGGPITLKFCSQILGGLDRDDFNIMEVASLSTAMFCDVIPFELPKMLRGAWSKELRIGL
ncbi:hypothetical protein OIU84_020592 [Salix udensis]|uniref:Uncharacterized protein n=1 Tax=Salix udensis TaxID=889485 RepID=A0AAD6PH73_9ROSI|nr:hypothetical protein OIU84_020592 [Salix udensis]